MVSSSSCRASQIHICGIINIRIAMNYLVKLNQAKVKKVGISHSRTLTGWGQLTIETQAYYSHTLLGICR